jgi:predicted membrane-bound mannosyltransferase
MIAKIGQKERLIICIFLLLVIAFITRLNTLNDKIFEVDEAIYSVSGGMIQNGHVMYRDIWDHGPL